jgi:hypothetical protein
MLDPVGLGEMATGRLEVVEGPLIRALGHGQMTARIARIRTLRVLGSKLPARQQRRPGGLEAPSIGLGRPIARSGSGDEVLPQRSRRSNPTVAMVAARPKYTTAHR